MGGLNHVDFVLACDLGGLHSYEQGRTVKMALAIQQYCETSRDLWKDIHERCAFLNSVPMQTHRLHVISMWLEPLHSGEELCTSDMAEVGFQKKQIVPKE